MRSWMVLKDIVAGVSLIVAMGSWGLLAYGLGA